MGDRNTTQQEIRRRLLTPDEAMRLDPDHEVVFVAGQQPLYVAKSRYFVDRELSRRAYLPAPATSGRASRTPSPWEKLAPISGLRAPAIETSGPLGALTSTLDRERALDEEVGRQA